MPRPAKGTAASTSSQPQAAGFVGRYLRPLGLSACGGENLGRCFPILDSDFSNGDEEHLSNPSSQRCTPPTKTTQTERQPTRTEAHRERGTPTGDFWKRSEQHEPRRVPGHGAPPIEAVFHQAQAFNEAVFRQALPFLFSRWTCPT